MTRKIKKQTLRAFKVFNPDWTCKGFQYEIGKTYKLDGTPSICETGFHACKKVSDCFSYYSFDPKNKVAEVELSGVILGMDGDKQCASEITIIREIKWEEMLILANSGDRNSGNRNSGNGNSGDRNSGNGNSGNGNSGYGNSGNGNSGNRNSGHFNTITPDTILVFNKPCKKNVWDNAMKPNFIYGVDLCQWISWDSMNDDEKKVHDKAFITGGYLRTYGYKEAWANAYAKASKEEIKLLKALPNFDSAVFEEITGIKVE